MTTTRDTDPDTHTIADAWASSPLGQPEGEVRYGFATTGGGDAVVGVDQPQPLATRAPRTAALAFGLVAGAALGVVSFGYTEPVQTTVVVPGSGVVQNAPSHAVVATPSGPPAPSTPAAVPVSAAVPAPAAAPAPRAPADPGPPSAGDQTVVVDVSIPPLPPLQPLPDKPEPPDPDPPTLAPVPPPFVVAP